MQRDDNLAIWEAIAPWWETRISAADHAHFDFALELLDPQSDQTILEIGCGGGHLARLMATGGAHVVATDATRSFLELASRQPAEGVEYRRLDATSEADIAALGGERFDAAIATMVLMNLPRLEPLARGLRAVLRPGAPFVFTVVHPAFSAIYWTADRGGRRSPLGHLSDLSNTVVRWHLVPRSLVIWGGRMLAPLFGAKRADRYLVAEARRGGDLGQPVPHINYHRPLHLLLEPFFSEGFVLDALGEPSDPGKPGRSGVLIGRLRRLDV